MAELIFFDYDGTIVDSSETIMPAYIATAKEMGIQLPFRNKFEFFKWNSPNWRDNYRRLGISEEDIPRCNEIYRECARTIPVPVFEGMEEVIYGLSKKYRLAIVTSNQKDLVTGNIPELLKYFELIVDAGMVSKLKPDPEPFHLAANTLGVNLRDTISIGDMPLDITAARAAGIGQIVAVLWGTHGMEMVIAKEKPDITLTRVEQLLML